jgi:hypothetical protein
MTFKTGFRDTVYEGDTITCTVDGFDCTATLYRDDCSDSPDQRQDGFWPSLDPKSAGYIGPKSKRALAREQIKMQRVMSTWENDEWHYYGVAVTVTKNEIELTGKYNHALWGIEGNWPVGRLKGRNRYFLEVANELLADALAEAKEKVLTLIP